jgi:hypothetical protein
LVLGCHELAPALRVFVLTVTYAGGRTQQFSVRRERVAEVRRWLDNYPKLKQAIEDVCELNHELLRPELDEGDAAARRAQLWWLNSSTSRGSSD